MTTTKLYQYNNGNCAVEIFTDGTKTRSYDGIPSPIFPESIDLKITNQCDAGCAWCHEQSVPTGEHADLNFIKRLIDPLPAGVEIAIGGGNPLAYPHLLELLQYCKSRGLIANLTINNYHAAQPSLAKMINEYYQCGLFYGLGISNSHRVPMWLDKDHPAEKNPNTVIHLILGIDRPNQIKRETLDKKILLLGYKQFGFGLKFYGHNKIEENISEWKYWIGSLMSKYHISFDNLALRQLCIQNKIPKELWLKHYMGDDGQFTMYVDAVKQQYAISSTSARNPCSNLQITDMFREIQRSKL